MCVCVCVHVCVCACVCIPWPLPRAQPLPDSALVPALTQTLKVSSHRGRGREEVGCSRAFLQPLFLPRGAFSPVPPAGALSPVPPAGGGSSAIYYWLRHTQMHTCRSLLRLTSFVTSSERSWEALNSAERNASMAVCRALST